MAGSCHQRCELFGEFKMYSPQTKMKEWDKDLQFPNSSPCSSPRAVTHFLMFGIIFNNSNMLNYADLLNQFLILIAIYIKLN